jgi:hypothetical protein
MYVFFILAAPLVECTANVLLDTSPKGPKNAVLRPDGELGLFESSSLVIFVLILTALLKSIRVVADPVGKFLVVWFPLTTA